MKQMSSDRSIKQEIENWLRHEGYPLEMEVAATFRKADFVVIQSEFYIDPESDKLREIDVRAFWTSDRKRGGLWVNVDLACCIECKLSGNKPWVLFTSEILPTWNSHVFISTKAGKEFLSKPGYFLDQISSSSLIRNKPMGHGIAQAFSKGVDIPYLAVQSAVKASVASASQITCSGLDVTSKTFDLDVAIPIIVVDSLLFEAKLDANSNIKIDEIESGILFWEGTKDSRCLVHIFSKSGLPGLPAQVINFGETLLECDAAFRDIYQEHVGKSNQ
jgi:hypothetical protein